jgi:DNA-binding NarL/FixJ family response regulator
MEAMNLEQDPMMPSCGAPYWALPSLDHAPSKAAAITVMLASNRNAVHTAWIHLLACASGIEVVGGTCTDPACLATRLERHLPKVLLLDHALLDRLGPRSLRRIQQQCGCVRVLLLCDEFTGDLVAEVLRNRFKGFLLTTCLPGLCLKAIRAVSKGELWLSRAALADAIALLPVQSDRGDVPGSTEAIPLDAATTLTPRELEVVELVRRGWINKEIARELAIAEGTVKKHLQGVFSKLGVHRRTLVALRQWPVRGDTHCIPCDTGAEIRCMGEAATIATPPIRAHRRLRLG